MSLWRHFSRIQPSEDKSVRFELEWWRIVKSKSYTQSKRPSDKNKRPEFCQSSVKQTHGLRISRKKGSDFFDHRGTLRMGSCGSVWVKYHSSRLSRLLTKTLVRQLNAACLSLFGSNADFRYPCRAIGHTVGHSSDFSYCFILEAPLLRYISSHSIITVFKHLCFVYLHKVFWRSSGGVYLFYVWSTWPNYVNSVCWSLFCLWAREC